MTATNGSGSIIIRDEGTILTAAVSSINFVGLGVTASSIGTAVTVNISGGTGSGTPTPSVSLLLHYEGANNSTTFTDSSPIANPITRNGNAVISTAQSKLGGSSGYFPGDQSSYLSLAGSPDFDFDNDFRVETFVRLAEIPVLNNFAVFIEIGGYSTGGIRVGLLNSSSVGLGAYIDGVLDSYHAPWSVSIDTWYHFAVARSGATVRFFIDKTQIGSGFANAAAISSSSGIRIGQSALSALQCLNGYLDETQVTKNLA